LQADLKVGLYDLTPAAVSHPADLKVGSAISHPADLKVGLYDLTPGRPEGGPLRSG
jgi:hypothetical protein